MKDNMYKNRYIKTIASGKTIDFSKFSNCRMIVLGSGLVQNRCQAVWCQAIPQTYDAD